jgi:pyruvate dehydrogenase E2 component (dihydrolipoamide acetyltransferase)
MIVEFKLPDLGENLTTGDVVKVMVAVGEKIAENQPLLELETDKAVIEVPSSVAGIVKSIHVQAGQKAKVGELVLTIETTASVPETSKTPTEKKSTAPTASDVNGAAQKSAVHVTPSDPRRSLEASVAPAPASPTVRKLAREVGLDINTITGSGAGGRISIEDVKAYARMLNMQAVVLPSSTASTGSQPLPDFSRWGVIRRQPMNAVRRKTAEHLSHAWQTIPHITQFDHADVTEIEEIRKRFAGKVEAAGGKLTYTAIALKVIASALKRFPQFNASVDVGTEEIIYKNYYHIGVAVDTDRGLLVPVIRDVDKKNLLQIAAELAQISERARQRKTALEEMQGGTFSITNLGSIGGTHFTPIVNWPEVAILALSQAAIEPVYRGGKFEPRLMLPVALSYDHRLIDGADGARFLRWVASAMEDPFVLALEG